MVEEDLKKKAVEQAQKILNDAGVEYWFFPILLNDDGYESFLAVNKFHAPNQESERMNVLELNVGGLCHVTQWILRTGLKLEGYDQEAYSRLSFAFGYFASKYNKHLQDIDPNFTGKYDENGKPINFK